MGGGRSLKFALQGGMDQGLMEELQEAARGLMAEAELSPAQSGPVYAVLVEICTNVMEHSQAQWIELALVTAGAVTCLSISDNGLPFDPVEKIQNHQFNLDELGEEGRKVGFYMIKQLTQSMRYLRENGEVNRVMLQMAAPRKS